MTCLKHLFPLLALGALLAPALLAQRQPETLERRALSANVIVPQSRTFAAGQQGVQVTGVTVHVKIVDQTATTTYEVKLHNPGARMAEAEMLLPVPAGCVISKFDFDGIGSEPSATLLPIVEARRIYNEIVRRYKDPALMQFAGLNVVRTSVFPVEPGGNQAIRFTYEHVCDANANRVDYMLPRTEALSYELPWNISVNLHSTRAIGTVYSPSHTLEVTRHGDSALSAKVADASQRDPGAFHISWLLGDGVTASLFAYPDPAQGGGYFLMVAGVPAKAPDADNAIRREVTIVLDRSGSMRGEKWEQAKESVLQVIASLRDGEAFNVVTFSNGVDTLFAKPQLRSKDTEKSAAEFLTALRPNGGTNIHDALVEALRPAPIEGTLPMVLFITDGLPTIGNTQEKTIRELAAQHNAHKRRIFSVGVGTDVNAPLLEALSDVTRAAPTFVAPGENVEVKVGDIARRLKGPVLADPIVDLPRDSSGGVRVIEHMPGLLPDLFEGDQLVLIGRYTGDAPVTFTLRGNYLGKERTFDFTFSLDNATTKNAFVPRLWAARRVAQLIDGIRMAGADTSTPDKIDPRFKEVVDEIVRLSTEFGILTEYTAFLALEGTDLSRKTEVQNEAWSNLQSRGQQQRSGNSGWSQSNNAADMKRASKENKRNEYYDDKLNRVSVGVVQQMNDRVYFKKGTRWVDTRLVEKPELKPDQTIKLGSDEYVKLIERLTELGREGTAAIEGEIIIEVDGKVILVQP
ncbi:MAG: VWA domain-containing protein [Planctomycetes bacterium]|nr:VWA domain-containing protein [Planctomycetota bacterium]